MNIFKVDMDNSKSSYIVHITRHAKERFSQRFNNDLEDPTETMLSLFKKSEETSSFLNYPNLLQHFYDTHGYDRKYFYLYKKVVMFVCEKKENRICILTCMKAPLWAKTPHKFKKKEPLVSVA